MKKNILIILIILVCTLSASAQDWKTEFIEEFDGNNLGWPLGAEVQGTAQIDRVIKESSYVWTLTSQEPAILWMGLNTGYPEENKRYRFSAEIRLPEFEPLTCAGLMLDNHENTFYGFVVCNDKTYSLFRSENGSIETLIPYSTIKDYDNFSSFNMAAEINNGWVDLYYNEESLDIYNISFEEGSFGLIAMPQSTDNTEISYGSLSFESSAQPQETTFEASVVDPNASGNIARLIKMLNMKERISSTAGSFITLPDKDMSLAMMGYSSRESFGINQQDILLQTDIEWSSGYDRPDYSASGCGFYLRGADDYNYIEIYAAMDGGIHVNAFRNGVKSELITLKYSNWSIEGSGRLAAAAVGQKITILWNDSILGTITDSSFIWSGDAGYILHSGTNGDFGTRCVFNNGEGYFFQ